MSAIRDSLSGKKTYLVAAVAIIGSVVAWLDGSIDMPTLAQSITAAILAATIRAGITKSGE